MGTSPAQVVAATNQGQTLPCLQSSKYFLHGAGKGLIIAAPLEQSSTKQVVTSQPVHAALTNFAFFKLYKMACAAK